MTDRVPLAVRLVTAAADRDITADLQSPPSFRIGQYGFASATLALARPLSSDAPEIAPYGRVYITDGRHGGTVFEGYMEDPGAGVGGDGEVWEITAMGPSARLEDQVAPYVYIDRGFDGWARADNVTPGGQVDLGINPGIVIGAGEDAMTFRFPQGLTVTTDSRVAMRYLPLAETGQLLAAVNYRWDCGTDTTIQQVQLTVRDAGLVEYSPLPRSQNWVQTGSSGQVKKITTDWPADRVYADLRIYRSSTTGTVNTDGNWAGLTGIYVMGSRYNAAGTQITAAASYTDGSVLASEVIADVLGRLLPTFDGSNARIDTSSYAIDHLAFPDGVTARQIIERLIELEPTFYFAAYESPPCILNGKHRSEWRAWPTTVRYEATTVDGYSAPSSVTELFDRVVVRWYDIMTRPRRTIRTQTVPVLAAAGIVRQGDIDLGSEAGSVANANQAGDGFLFEHGVLAKGGSLLVARPILDRDTGRMVMPWEIRPNTLIRITDLAGGPDQLVATARDGRNVCRVIAVNFDGTSGAASLDLDSPPRSRTPLTLGSSKRPAPIAPVRR
jgi:hypothetical protein